MRTFKHIAEDADDIVNIEKEETENVVFFHRLYGGVFNKLLHRWKHTGPRDIIPYGSM